MPWALLMVLMTLGACTPERDPGELFSPEDINVLVVDATLIVGQPLPRIKLTRTQAPDTPFDWVDAAVVGAEVTVTSNGATTVYSDAGSFPGFYFPTGQIVEVTPSTVYELSITTDEGETLTAATTTPAHFQVDSWLLLDSSGSTVLRELETFTTAGGDVYNAPANQIHYTEGLLDAVVPSGGAAVFEASGYQLALFSLDLDSDYVVEPPFFEDEDFQDLSRSGSSPAINGEDGSLRLPWFGIYYEGRHLYKVYALDQNWYDLVRSIPENDGGLGFGGNVGDSFARPIFNINGGIGLFGSASVDSIGFNILPPE